MYPTAGEALTTQIPRVRSRRRNRDPNLWEFRELLCPIQAGLNIELCRRPVFIEQNCISPFLTMGFPTAEEARITCAIVDAAAKVRDLNFKTWPKAKARPSPPASAPTASPSATRTARGKVRRGCFRRFTTGRFELFTTRRFELLSGAISQNQEPLFECSAINLLD